MIELIILLWMAIKLNAPVWIYILMGVIALIKAVAFGINLSKNNQTLGGKKLWQKINAATVNTA